MARNDYKVLDKAYNLFDNATEMASDNFRRKLIRTLTDEEFLMAVFRPTGGPGYGKEDLSAKIAQLYDAASRRKTISAISDALDDYGYGGMGRPSAVFLVTLVNLGMASIDAKATDLGRQQDHDDISNRDFNRHMERLDDFQDDLFNILKVAQKIVKGKAKNLAHDTSLPKEICMSALFSVPSPDYLDQFKIGFYLKNLLGNIYGFVNMNAEEMDFDFDDVDWKLFFTAVFGKTRVPDVASLILLEGAGNIDKYKNAHYVRECWDSLTQFALKTLNHAPESVRDQMIELYLKRLNKMLADHSIDLRVDLRTIDNFRFENLADTIIKYKSKIDSVMSRINRPSDRPSVAP